MAYTEMLGARKKVHDVEDSMRVRAHLVASARRHLENLTSPDCPRLEERGNLKIWSKCSGQNPWSGQ
jgi:uncharacterized protein YlaN (UPF0358 family)